MKKHKTTLCLVLGSLLALDAGCGKTENVSPAAKEAERTRNPPPAVPAQAAPKPVAPPANALAAATNEARPNLNPPVTPSEPAAPPAKPLPPEAALAPSPATSGAQPTPSQAKTDLAGLSRDQMVQGLQDALGKGLKQAVAKLGHQGGFLTNLNVRIPMPEKLQKVETALRAMKQDKLADDFVATMNRAAEEAVPEAAGVFADALKQMTIEDATAILSGPNDAATQYLRRTTVTNLYSRFYPIVQKATERTGVTAAYKSLVGKTDVTKSLGGFGSALGGALLDKDALNVDAYVTTKAMDGLFKMVAEEEKQIRQNPIARTTEMLQKVFGALKK